MSSTAEIRAAAAGHLPLGAENLDRLDPLQVGHLRHIRNLAAQPDGEWTHMGIDDPWQEAVTAYRYQLAYMAYALAVTHFNRLPGAPGAFVADYRNLMRKMMRRDVWGFWENTSRSSLKLDPGLTELREGWRDPVIKENIMYSGHVHAMTGLYGVLFDDDRYEKPGGLTFSYNPIFAEGKEDFVYDFTSLTEVIYWQMVENGFLGVACEPNMIFLVCNQFPMLGFRFHDVRKGTAYADEVTQGYAAAWERKGWLTKGGHFIGFWFVRQDMIAGANTAWTASVMNAWNPEVVRSLYPRQVERAFEEPEAGMLLPRTPKDSADSEGRHTKPNCNVGLSAVWLAEMGDHERLSGLLRYADTYLGARWDRGGYFYPRNDALYDEAGRYVHMDPWVGNGLLPFARLNVEDGLRKLYEQPWGAAHFAEPNLAAISPHADVLRAGYLPDSAALVLTLQALDPARPTSLTLANVIQGSGVWRVERDGVLIAAGARHGLTENAGARASWTDDGLRLDLDVTEPTDIVVWVDQ